MKKKAFQHATPLAQEVESFRRSYPKVAAKVCKGVFDMETLRNLLLIPKGFSLLAALGESELDRALRS